MLNFRNTNIIFVLLLLITIATNYFFNLPSYIFFILILFYAVVLFYGSYYVGSNFFMKVLCAANTHKRQIAISFDDGPVDNYTKEIVELLKTHDVQAAFFCIGKNIEGKERMLKKIIENGHIIGNHSYSHSFLFDFFSTKKMLVDLQLMDDKLKNAVGLQPQLFRPPYGVTTPNMKKVMRKGGYTAIGWNIRSLDTVIKNKEKLLHKITTQLQPGAVILLHDTSKTTLSILPQFISHARSQGYEFVRIDKLLNVKPYA